jgi:CBS domain containing-hemolysin-like protein
MMLTHILLLTAALVLFNALFVAAEFALIGAPKTTIERRAGQGDALASRIHDILTSPTQQDRYIATSQLGITVASLGLGMYGEHALAALIEPRIGEIPFIGGATLASAIALTALTLVHIVFGEMSPKSLALQHSERVARVAYWPMRVALVLFYPFVRTAGGLAALCLRVLGVKRQENVREQSYTPEELQLIVEESQQGGALRADSGRLLRELFEFGDLTAAQVMVPRVRVVGLPVGAPPSDIRAMLLKSRHTRYPIYEGDLDHIVGMLHVKDLLRRLVLDQPVALVDVRPMPVVPETAPLDDLLATMQRGHAHMATVIDEHGGTAGVVSLEDLFEEVVGEIEEGAAGPARMVPRPDGSVMAAGTVRLDELGQYFDVTLEHPEVDSLSGLVLAILGRSPVAGDVVDYGRIRLRVTGISGRGVTEVRAWLAPSVAQEE